MTTNLDLADNLLKDSGLFAHAYGFAHQSQRHGRFDLLALNQPLEVRVHQAHAHRIDLTVREHHFGCFDTLHVDRKNCVATSVRSQNCGQFAQWRKRGHSVTFATVNRHGHLAVATRAARIIFPAALARSSVKYDLFFLCHNCFS